MRITFVCLWILIMGAQPVAARDVAFTSPDKIISFINSYRDDPRPDLLPKAVRAMSKLQLLRDPDKAGLYVGFAAGVIGTNQLQADKLISAMFPMPPIDQYIIIKAVTYSGLPTWKGMLGRYVERMPARTVMINQFMTGKLKTLLEAPLDQEPSTIDALWGYYLATGTYEPISRIITALQWADEKSNLDRLTIGSMAKWTLASNAANDRGLLNLYRVEVRAVPKTIEKPLREVIGSAEAFTTHKIRKEQVAKIETLKVRGPSKASKWAWASQAGQIALSVGCVVASAFGQVQIAAPCVVTGAVFTGATKMYELYQKKP